MMDRRSFLGALVAAPAVHVEQPRRYYWIHRHPAPCGDGWSKHLITDGMDVRIYHHRPREDGSPGCYVVLEYGSGKWGRTWDGHVADYERVCRVCFP